MTKTTLSHAPVWLLQSGCSPRHEPLAANSSSKLASTRRVAARFDSASRWPHRCLVDHHRKVPRQVGRKRGRSVAAATNSGNYYFRDSKVPFMLFPVGTAVDSAKLHNFPNVIMQENHFLVPNASRDLPRDVTCKSIASQNATRRPCVIKQDPP